jgi:mannose-6-phosphate isomerase-like protein (cupin superfamily)
MASELIGASPRGRCAGEPEAVRGRYGAGMPTYTKLNLTDVKDLAPEYGMQERVEARFARQALGAQRIGLAHYRVAPGQRLGFGHRHGESEEMYVVLGGSGRFRVGDDVLDVGLRDVVYCPPDAMREWEGGPEGMELLAFGAHSEGEEQHMEHGWWAD